MVVKTTKTSLNRFQPLPLIAEGMPLLYEDEGFEMGESDYHTDTVEILSCGLKAHLRGRRRVRAFFNLNLYYSREDPHAYVSPDGMVVVPSRSLTEEVNPYSIGIDGPAPILTAEILSQRTAQQGDLTDKLIVYARLKVQEYMLIDVTGRFLKQRLLLKRLQPDGIWMDEQDADGGITSQLGFRLIIEKDGRLRVIDAKTGNRYLRPDEAEDAKRARETAEQRIRELEEELATLRNASRSKKKKSTDRRKPKD